jgi:L-arabonate dehydrase
VKDEDMIALDVAGRSLHLHVGDEELVARRKAWTPPQPHAARGYQKFHVDRVLQADRGVDFDFLVGRSGSPVPRDNH